MDPVPITARSGYGDGLPHASRSLTSKGHTPSMPNITLTRSLKSIPSAYYRTRNKPQAAGHGCARGGALPVLAASLIALSLASCASYSGGSIARGFGGPAVNYAAGSALGVNLPPADAGALQPIFVQAVSRGAAGERFDWRGRESFGWVKAGDFVLGNVKADRFDRPAFPDGLFLRTRLETELGPYALTRNANVRAGPSTDYPVYEQLPSGTGVEGIGRVVGEPWILAEQDGRIVGYIHESLMTKAPGTELLLAGGPTRTPLTCRTFEQRISYTGRSDLWEGVACLEDDQWVLQEAPANAPVRLY